MLCMRSGQRQDNMQADGDIMDFYLNGGVAPGGRFTFAFSDKAFPGVKDDKSDTGFQTILAVIKVISVRVIQ